MKRLGIILGATALAATLSLSAIQPAKADGAASTRNIILGAAALVGGFAIESNVQHKQKLATTVSGYTPNGATVYADGHVVLPNGQSYYPSKVGQTVACTNGACTISGNGYNTGYYNPGYNNGGYNGGYYNGGYYNGN